MIGERTVELAAMLFAVGLDPDVATVFVQSHVARALPAGWVMECTVSFGELSRMTQFKDKSAKREGEFISAGLFTYPALQAADILLYDADEVPVGDDQRQHVEITRDIAMRFNHRFGETFVVPKAVTPRGRRAGDGPPGPDVEDEQVGRHRRRADPAARRPGVDRAQVQAGGHRLRDRGALRPERQAGRVSNLLEILAAATGQTPDARWPSGYTQYGPLKADTGDAVVELLEPIQARYRELIDDRGELAALLRKGADKARGRRARHDAAAGLRPHRPAAGLTRSSPPRACMVGRDRSVAPAADPRPKRK